MIGDLMIQRLKRVLDRERESPNRKLLNHLIRKIKNLK